jgi:hypothetical protein
MNMAVTANQLIVRAEGCMGSAPVAASTRLYQGTLAFINASGYLESTTGSGANRFAGVNIKDTDNSSGSAGDLTAELWKDGQFTLVGTGFTQASVGLIVYATDNYTVTTTPASGAVQIGVCSGYISSTKISVTIDIDCILTSAAVAAAGSAQGDAATLTGVVNIVSAADGTKGVIVPVSASTMYVYNTHATNGLKIYPPTGGDFNDGSANAAITIEGKTLAIIVNTDGTTFAATYTANS